ncbi:MAG: Glycosyl transferase, family 2 [Candidatus Magasanikbacteria bacterium GW2011_GWA2_37_8]|uniref:Glycosyl transferase, family 2 n=1 Tax=Candidatus Magasanikbacteria bacterium GW2011_GWA2_37_8 TaxID=1619036 RepID=A0A0G0HBT3_9BACT|nr:MAG: Glycosyl transferase, family 2 [Candidatus Magasanikbacteria bacterium GW2011_GWA2_37_8]
MPEVSITIAAYNCEKTISRAIESVLLQSYIDWELVIIDDYSSDNTRLIIEQYAKKDQRIHLLINENNLGIYKTRLKSLGVCKGDLIAVLDSDDIWSDSGKLKKQINFLKDNKDCVLVGGMAKVIDENEEEIGVVIRQNKDEEIRKKILSSNQFVHSSVMFRKKVAESVGGYGEFSVGEDYDLFLRMGLKGKFANLTDILVYYRRHSSNVTWKNRVISAKEHLKIIKKYKKLYPNFLLALLKAYLRILFAYLNLLK